jgi:malonate transporter
MVSIIANTLTPVFFILALGFFAGKRKIIDNQQVRSLNLFVMNFALPIALFKATSQTPRIKLLGEYNFVLVLVLTMWSVYAINYFIQAKVFGTTRGENSVRALTVALPNVTAIALPLLVSVLGQSILVDVAISICVGAVFLSPITLVILAATKASAQGLPVGKQMKDLVIHLLERPIVIGPFTGIIVALMGWHIPDIALNSCDLIGKATPGVALFLTGLVLSTQNIRFSPPVITSVLLKNFIQPFIAFGFVLALGLTGPSARAAELIGAVPCGFFGILFGLSNDVKSDVAGASLLLSSILSIFTLSAAIYFTASM